MGSVLTTCLHPNGSSKPPYLAEKALATLHSRPVPSVEPPYQIKLTPSPEGVPLSALVSGHPRLIKGLPERFTDIQTYRLLRPFGVIATVRNAGPLFGLVQFWTGEEATQADAKLSSAAPPIKITLTPYDPCTLFCGASPRNYFPHDSAAYPRIRVSTRN